MKVFQSILVSALAFVAATDAWEITSAGPTAPESIVGTHETVAKTWTISGNESLHELDIYSIGRVFVDYDASLAPADGNATDATVVAKIVLSGTNSSLLDAFEVVNVDDKSGAVKLRFKNQDLEDKGFLLTQIFVSSKQSLNQIALAWNADLVVGEDVLINHNASASVNLALAGSGSIYAGSSDASIELGGLELAVAGSGDIQFLAKTATFNSSLGIHIAGSGDIAVLAEEVNVSELETAIAGSGDVFVEAESLTAFNLTTAIAGSGTVTYSRNGSCQHQEIALAGSGDVAAGSIVCVDTAVNVVGSGDAVVQTTRNLTVSAVFASGDIRYYGAKPSVIEVHSALSFRGSHKKKWVKETTHNDYEMYELEEPPLRQPVFIALKTTKSVFSDEPNVDYLIEADIESEALVREAREFAKRNPQSMVQTQSLAARTFAHPHKLLFSAVFVGAAFAAVGIATHKYKGRSERARYQPLI